MSITHLETTTITRAACNMWPDPCPCRDYIITTEAGPTRIHHRGHGCWMVEEGGLRKEWADCGSLQEAVDWIEGRAG